VGPRDGLNVVKKRKVPCAHRESNPDSLVVQPVAYSPYRLSYPGSLANAISHHYHHRLPRRRRRHHLHLQRVSHEICSSFETDQSVFIEVAHFFSILLFHKIKLV
jgi:hypothetical protein